eukprot:CAMPEP_0168588210 /NCGR_PEP_ID=MMETSP0420-20121227/5314_1 /TAXON_ID=498008 /ORGANISM="Pessonella sp." /LENGTH=482 /DNA_ID=CAMNT_0008623589 /DNA_START=336 /DNA_END=1784 /DNA_ORIENTATION=+
MATGSIEIEATKCIVLNTANNPLPIPIAKIEGEPPREEVRLRHRYLDLRTDFMQRNLQLRSKMFHAIRNELVEFEFTEVETPTLFRKTAEGAREFVVPTRQQGKFYALPQSPQQYKQMLVAGGIHRYYQFARCYRDEDSRSDRQPEFTQLDMEMGFATAGDVMNVAERVARRAVEASIAAGVLSREALDDAPFPIMNYADALNRFGSDKPDLRYGLELVRLDETRVAIVVPKGGEMDALSGADVGIDTSDAVPLHFSWLTPSSDASAIEALNLDSIALNDAVVIIENGDATRCSDTTLLTSAGRVRTALADTLQRHALLQFDDRSLKFVWIVNFPLFERDDDDTANISSSHHPFTAPISNDEAILRSSNNDDELLTIRGQHYDLVLNGVEIGGGSVRVHDAALQRRVFECLKLTTEQVEEFSHLLEALEHGCPPHAGIAFGMDRFVATLSHCASIRDVIAFPKTAGGNDLLSKAPSSVDDAQ